MPLKRTFADIPLLLITGALIVFGLVMLASASAPGGYDKFGDSYYYVKHQVVFGLIPGLFGMFIMSRIPHAFWKRHAMGLLLASVVLLVLVFIPGFSAGIGTAHSWVSVGGWFSFQPSEIVKLTFLFYLCAWLAARGEEGMKDLSSGFVTFALALGGVMALLIAEPDIGTMSILAGMAVAVYFAAGAPILYVGGLIGGGIAALAALIGLAPYRAARFMTFLNPELDPQGIGYQMRQALIAIGSGGIWGRGLALSRQKFNYLPEPMGDSIFAIIAEEFGFIGSVSLLIMLLLFYLRGIIIIRDVHDLFGKLLGFGALLLIIVQAIVNIAAISGVMPLTGIPLSFISYGGSSLAITLLEIGVILNISKMRL